MLFLAGLQGIPAHLYEAAEIDGATSWIKFRHITLPLAVPGIITATIFAFTVSWAQFLYPLVFTTSVDQLVLPVGISFYTFQSMSYTIDVYRKELPATKSPIEFATFVLFFPQLVAGPIVRAYDFLPQLDEKRQAVFEIQIQSPAL